MDTTLLIMAAGIGSRFGGGIKQLEPVDDQGHIIIDYSIHDAIKAGFNKVVFIIRKDIETDFKEVVGDRIAQSCAKQGISIEYAFQSLSDTPGTLPEGRRKPWGTGQAVLAARHLIKTPFVVINADDYYGKECFVKVHDYLVKEDNSCMVGFILKNTLSDNGCVTRGVCQMDANASLIEINETKNIQKTANGAEADGVPLDLNSLVSMNMWGFQPTIFDALQNGFSKFWEKLVQNDPMKSEYLIPDFVSELLARNEIKVSVLQTDDIWYGMTYKADVEEVRNAFAKMIQSGEYRNDLFSDL